MPEFKPVSPPVYILDGGGKAYTVFGWLWDVGSEGIEPVVANPDGPGIGAWRLYYGEDPWRVT